VQIDLTTLRLPASGAELATSELFSDIYTHLFEEDFRSSYTKHMVYYDGPLATDRICGQGGSSSSGFGLAVVYVRACSGVASAAVAAHELLHTLGAVPRGAPNDCPEPNDAHTCDDPNDIMHPFIDRSPLASKALDPGRNDYYGHSSGFVDTQDSPWLVRLDSQAQLALQISGSGTVESDVPGLSCTQTCTTSWNSGTEVSLTATPGPGSKLVRFTGACTGAFDCTVTVGAGSAVSVLFAPLTYRLSVAVSGRGTVRSSRPGIACRSRCSAAFPSYVPLRLDATPAKGWKLRTWRGACTGTRASCTLPMSAAASARAVFVRR
jgi:hypothetical protein